MAAIFVVPEADLKVFLTAKPETRAKRRLKEHPEQNYDETLASIIIRDEIDTKREHSPLKPTPDAMIIYNDDMTLIQAVEMVIQAFKSKVENFN